MPDYQMCEVCGRKCEPDQDDAVSTPGGRPAHRACLDDVGQRTLDEQRAEVDDA